MSFRVEWSLRLIAEPGSSITETRIRDSFAVEGDDSPQAVRRGLVRTIAIQIGETLHRELEIVDPIDMPRLDPH